MPLRILPSKQKEWTQNAQETEHSGSGAKEAVRNRSRTLMDKLRVILRVAFSFPVMLAAWNVWVVVRLAEWNLPDVDIWWHLRNAQYLFTHHQLPNIDTYSFTVAGQPWMNHEWLGEIPYYLAWRAFGLEGIEILMLLLLEAIFLGVLLFCYQRSRHIKASVLACWLAVFLATANFAPLTILFGYGYLVILLAILERFRSKGRAPLWMLPLLFCIWINTHGSWSLGIIVLGILLASGVVGGEWGSLKASRWSPRQLRQLLVAFAASCATLFVNPYGYRLVTYPLDMAFRQPLVVAMLQEWRTVDFHGPIGWKDPKLKVFVDGRVDIFERAGVLDDYAQVQTLAAPIRVLDKYQIRYVLYPSQQPLTYMLKTSPDWKTPYTGQIAVLFERVGPGQR